MDKYESVKHIAKYVPVDELALLENNPRTIKKEAFEKLKKSVNEYREYFEGRPCLANKVGDKITVFAGNQRLRAARALGWKEVPCVIYENLSAEEQQRLTIKDNVQLGEWDFDLLANEFDEVMLKEELGEIWQEPDLDKTPTETDAATQGESRVVIAAVSALGRTQNDDILLCRELSQEEADKILAVVAEKGAEETLRALLGGVL